MITAIGAVASTALISNKVGWNRDLMRTLHLRVLQQLVPAAKTGNPLIALKLQQLKI